MLYGYATDCVKYLKICYKIQNRCFKVEYFKTRFEFYLKKAACNDKKAKEKKSIYYIILATELL